jgi:beta-glucosidase
MNLGDPRLDRLVSRLDLRAKVRLLTGRDLWSTWPNDGIGLRSIVMSDGPSGVRGPAWDERSPSANLPSASALSATWDPSLAREYGAALAAEARRKGVDVVLGPTVNLHRSPLGGRHFEAFSEDPLLTARLAAAYVAGLQENGVAATPKHYVANDSETERFTVDVRVGERALRELYLTAFEQAVVESKAWAVMSAYNSVNGATMTENELLETPLGSEWGFDGVVVSDWTAVRSLASARFSQDLVMPGPAGSWGEDLVAAVESGTIDEAVVNRKVKRILLLAARVGALDGFARERGPSGGGAPAAAPPEAQAFARSASARGMVLVQNDGILPLSGTPRRIAVIGHSAASPRTQGGGSATVIPERVVSPLEGIRDAFAGAEVVYAQGAVVHEGLADLPLEELRNPVTGAAGVRVRFLDAAGAEIFAEDRLATSYVWLGGEGPVDQAAALECQADWCPRQTGTANLGCSGFGRLQIWVDGSLLLEDEVIPDTGDPAAGIVSRESRSAPIDVVAGRVCRLMFRCARTEHASAVPGAASFAFGVVPNQSGQPETLIAEASRAAAGADVAVLVVGTNPQIESEGFDRTGLDLPGEQDRLARAVLAANSRTVVVVNSGAPVALPWAEDAAAVLLTWFGGQEYGAALADVLSGAAEPGGRLPTTWPRTLEDVPVANTVPTQGVLQYDEGVHIGYRAWLRGSAQPRWWFGEGLGYTDFDTGAVRVDGLLRPGTTVIARVPVSNVGKRAGRHVVQLYASRPDSTVERPVRWLVGFESVELDPGEATTLQVKIPARSLAHWANGAWAFEPGDFLLEVGRHAGQMLTGTALTLVT